MFRVPGAELINESIAVVIAEFLEVTSPVIAVDISDVTSEARAIDVGITEDNIFPEASIPAYPNAASLPPSKT